MEHIKRFEQFVNETRFHTREHFIDESSDLNFKSIQTKIAKAWEDRGLHEEGRPKAKVYADLKDFAKELNSILIDAGYMVHGSAWKVAAFDHKQWQQLALNVGTGSAGANKNILGLKYNKNGVEGVSVEFLLTRISARFPRYVGTTVLV
jgi:hypothetical protein